MFYYLKNIRFRGSGTNLRVLGVWGSIRQSVQFSSHPHSIPHHKEPWKLTCAAMDQMFVYLQSSYTNTLISNVIIRGWGPLGGQWVTRLKAL